MTAIGKRILLRIKPMRISVILIIVKKYTNILEMIISFISIALPCYKPMLRIGNITEKAIIATINPAARVPKISAFVGI